MGEIKSTMDIVLEKTKHLTLSEDEKKKQKKKEARQKILGLLQKYQDQVLDLEQLKDDLDALKKSYEFIDPSDLVSEILNRIELDSDNGPFLVILDDICRINSEGLKAVLSEYHKTVRLHTDRRSDQIAEKLNRDYRVTGSAVQPNLAMDDDWVADLQTIYTDYNRLLNREKDALLNIG